MIEKLTTYRTSDGTVYATEKAAVFHEERVAFDEWYQRPNEENVMLDWRDSPIPSSIVFGWLDRHRVALWGWCESGEWKEVYSDGSV